MTSWRPSLQGRRGPRYRLIAQALADDVETGRLIPGQRLPTHRELAFALGVTIGTVTRAYAEAERQGLTAGEVGRGTFVRSRFDSIQPSSEARYELGMNAPIGGSEAACFAQALHRLAENPALGELCTYPDLAGLYEHRAAACRMLAGLGVPATPERVMLTAGGGGALSAALDLLVHPGETIATEELTYPNFKALARMRDIRLRGLACDRDGILVDAFAEAAAEGGIKALYCIPTMHNPTGLTWSIERRHAIAEIARRHRIAIIEDDVYGFLVPDRPASFVSLVPELVLHVNAASKSLAPALRLGLLVVPQALVGRLTGSHWIASPLMAEIVRLWVEDGTAEMLMEEKRREGAARQAIVRRVLDQAGLSHAVSHPNAFHLWLPLPEGWRDTEAVAAAARIGIAVNPAAAFAVGRSEHNAIRLCFSRPAGRDQVERGVARLAELLIGSPEPAAPIA